MGFAIKNNNKVAIKAEVTEGTFTAPTVGSDFIQLPVDGFSMESSKEIIERDLLGQGLTATKNRTGMWSVSGSAKVEMKANGTEGEEPEFGLLMESALGEKRSSATVTSSDADGGTYSTSVICIDSADESSFAVGDMITIKIAGGFHTSPILSVESNEIELLVAAPLAFIDGLEIMAFTTYKPAESGHKSVSFSKYIEDAILEQAAGCRIKSLSLEEFSTGKLAFFNFGFEGLSTDRTVSANAITPEYDTALPPIILEACVYQDGVKIAVNDVSFSVENSLGFITSTCEKQGKLSSRVTKRTIKGSLNPYKSDSDVNNWDKFKNDESFSIYFSAKVPTGITGEYKDVVAVYMPICTSTSLGEADQDGVLQETIEFSVSGISNDEIFISFS